MSLCISCISLFISILTLLISAGSALYREEKIEQAQGFKTKEFKEPVYYAEDGTILNYKKENK